MMTAQPLVEYQAELPQFLTRQARQGVVEFTPMMPRLPRLGQEGDIPLPATVAGAGAAGRFFGTLLFITLGAAVGYAFGVERASRRQSF